MMARAAYKNATKKEKKSSHRGRLPLCIVAAKRRVNFGQSWTGVNAFQQ